MSEYTKEDIFNAQHPHLAIAGEYVQDARKAERLATIEEVRRRIQELRPRGSGWSTIGRTLDHVEKLLDAMIKEAKGE